MWTGIVSAKELQNANRWTVSLFKKTKAIPSHYQSKRLSELVRERGSFTEPRSLGDELVNYLGLENVRSQTGELVEFAPRKASSIKSRSKTFEPGDVLFGRLRPELNKVYLAHNPVAAGICSTEFAVLVCNEQKLIPRYLRHILSSHYVMQMVANFKAGAALPRVASSDLLSVEIPIPPLSVQQALATQLEHHDEAISRLRKELHNLPSAVASGLLEALEHGRKTIKVSDKSYSSDRN